MAVLNDLIQDNMVCATVNAPHDAGSVTIHAYLAAHLPERVLVFRISFPSPHVGNRCGQILADAGITTGKQDRLCLRGTASARVWTGLVVTHGPFLKANAVLLTPARPGRA